MKSSSRSGSDARADHSRSVLTCRPRQPASGVSNATALTLSAGSHTERTVPSDARGRLDRAAEADAYVTSGRSNSQGLPAESQSSGSLHLPAVLDRLPEDPVVVADAVAVRGNAERRHALHEAGGEAAEAAVAERGVRFEPCAGVEVDAQVAQRLARDPR